MSYYVSLNPTHSLTFCVKWRNGLRKVWHLPNRTHGDIIHMLAGDLPIFDITCKRIVGFVVCCLMHHNDLVNFIARQSLLYECGRSLLGRNLQFCSDRYRFRLRDVFDQSFNINRIQARHVLFGGDARFDLAALPGLARQSVVHKFYDFILVHRPEVEL